MHPIFCISVLSLCAQSPIDVIYVEAAPLVGPSEFKLSELETLGPPASPTECSLSPKTLREPYDGNQTSNSNSRGLSAASALVLGRAELTLQMFRFWNLPSLYFISVNLTLVIAAGNHFTS